MKLEKETRLKLAIGLSSSFCVVEVIGGYIANSIAIYSDAAHLLTDIAGFAIALVAVIAAKAPGTKHLTYGFARAEVFGALGSILSLWIITAFLLYAAYVRAVKWFEGHAEPVNGFFMFLVACFGVLVNICLGCVFQAEHGGDMHPSHSGCTHDHSHDGSHGHNHGRSATYSLLAVRDIEHGHADDHDHSSSSHGDHSSCSGHGHDHGHDSHSSHAPSDKTKLLASKKPSYNSNDDHAHDHGHDAGHDHSTCSGHGHSDHDHSDHDHSDHGHSVHGHSDHDHSGHDHSGCSGHGHSSHGHTDSDYQKTFEPSDVNIEAAYLHVLTDLIQSIGVALAGLIIWFRPHWQIIDPLCTFIFSFIALKTTVPLLGRVFGILFEGTPSHVDWEIVKDRLSAIPGVVEVHDLHIWSISSKSVSLTVHIKAHKPQEVLKAAHKICAEMSIDHATIQVQDAADEEDFCFSKGCDSHNPDAGSSGKHSTCVLTNHLDTEKSPRK